jgi:hypothetical protein
LSSLAQHRNLFRSTARLIAIAGCKNETIIETSLEEDPSDVGRTADIEETR